MNCKFLGHIRSGKRTNRKVRKFCSDVVKQGRDRRRGRGPGSADGQGEEGVGGEWGVWGCQMGTSFWDMAWRFGTSLLVFSHTI